jgi:hypothetical protein
VQRARLVGQLTAFRNDAVSEILHQAAETGITVFGAKLSRLPSAQRPPKPGERLAAE